MFGTIYHHLSIFLHLQLLGVALTLAKLWTFFLYIISTTMQQMLIVTLPAEQDKPISTSLSSWASFGVFFGSSSIAILYARPNPILPTHWLSFQMTLYNTTKHTSIISLTHLQCDSLCFGCCVCRLLFVICLSHVRSRKLIEIGAIFRHL